MPKFQAPKGTRDFYPADAAVRRWILETWRRVSVRNGFEEFDGPTFEPLDLYKAKSGDEIVEQLFHFTDRGGRHLALRPEMTPTLARMVAARAQGLAKPIRWFCMPAMFRAERPQRGRLREFMQWNIDILGEPGVIADAECIFVVIDLFRELGLSPEQVRVRINSRALVSAILEAAGFEHAVLPRIYPVLDKRDKLPEERFAKLVNEVAADARQRATLMTLGQAKGSAGLESIRPLLSDSPTGLEQHERLVHLFEILGQMGVADFCEFDMSVVRGLAYYTGVVFEAFGKGGLQRAICGGGRYDELLAEVGGPPLTGVGFGLGDVAVQDLATEFNLLPTNSGACESVFIIDAEPAYFDRVLALASQLRQEGVTAIYSYKRQSFTKQLRQASGGGAARVVIVDQSTQERGTVGVKDLQTGVQKDVEISAFVKAPFQDLGAKT
ncbi:MAG: histidine--tRNA ligase [Phycisphaerae bacterium]